MQAKTVLSFPYEGGLYYLLNQHLSWVEKCVSEPSGYYGVLFGRDALLTKSKATALGALFEEIILVGADSFLPDRDSATHGGDYWHPDFRIRVPNSHYAEWDADNKKLAEQLLGMPVVVDGFRDHYSDVIHSHDRLQMLCRLLLQMNAAHTYDAVIVGDRSLCALQGIILRALADTGDDAGQTFASESLSLDSSTLSLVGLEFNCADIDAFAAVRQSGEIRSYANDFRHAIATARSAPDLERHLIQLMREARDTANIAGKIAGGFETTSSITGWAGLIPGIGTVTGAIGLGTDAGARSARYIQEKREWYAIGSHMNRVALDDLLSRH